MLKHYTFQKIFSIAYQFHIYLYIEKSVKRKYKTTQETFYVIAKTFTNSI